MMSDYGRYGSADFRDREPRRRNQERGQTIFSGRDDFRDGDRGRDRNEGWERVRDAFSDDGDTSRRSRNREPISRDNQPGGRSGGGMFGRDQDRSSRSEREREDRLRAERERDRYNNDDNRRSLPINETEQLIASNKVEGTPVYGREGERLGTIYNFMVDKYSGRVTYAVMSYGGFLGVGSRYFPIPWQVLSYDTNEGGYRVDLDNRDLERAPSFDRSDEPRFNRDYGRRVHSWYGLDY